MEATRIQTGATERIVAVALSSALAPLTGLTDLLISIQRVSDGYWFDFADLTFKSVGWTTRQQAMTEISSTLAPGQYRYDLNTGTIVNASADDAYLVTVTQSPGTTVKNVPQVGELKVGQYVDDLDAAVSSRSTLTQAQILSDATPFPGARIDAAVSSRAAPGAAMDLVTDALDADALAASAVTEIQAGLATAAALSTVQSDLDDVQTRLPVALMGGRMDASVGAMASDVLTAAAIAAGAIGSSEAPLLANLDAAVSTRATPAEVGGVLVAYDAATGAQVATRAAPGDPMGLVTDALDADALAASAVAEIQTGLPTAVEVTAIQADVDEIKTRLPASLVGGRMRAHVEVMDADVIGAGQIAAGAIGAAEAPLLANLDTTVSSRATQAQILSDATPFPGARVDAAVSSRATPADVLGALVTYDAATGADVATRAEPGDAMSLVTDAVDADSLAASAVAEINAGLASAHGAGSWEGPAPAAVADAVWDEPVAGHVGAGSAGAELQDKPSAAEVDAQLSGTHGAGSWGGSSADAIADAVWDEAMAGHAAVGSAGEELQSKAGAAAVSDVQTRLPAALYAGRIRAHVETMDADVIGDTQIRAGAITPVEAPALANLDAAVSSRATQAQILSDATPFQGAHVDVPVSTRATQSQILSDATPFPGARIDAAISSRAVPGSQMDLLANAVDADALAASAVSEIEAALAAAHGSGSWVSPSAPDVADAVWDEAKAGHVGAGSFGEEVQSHATPAEVLTQVGSGLTAYDAATGAQVATRAEPGDEMDLVLNALDADALAASAVAKLGADLSAAHGAGSWEGETAEDVADAVWDESLGGHLSPGTAASELSGKPSAAEIEAALAAVHGAGSWESVYGYVVKQNFAFNPVTSLLVGNVWVERAGLIVPGPSTLTCSVFDATGVLLFSEADLAPDANGVFRIQKLSPGFTSNAAYYVVSNVAGGWGSVSAAKGLFTVA